jgi:site-specific DNA-methyltransferase (adenine-specific)
MKIPAPRNRTIRLTKDEINELKKNLIHLDTQVLPSEIENKIINQDLFDVIDKLPGNFVDLLFIDPPYNLDKNFSVNSKIKNYFKALKPEEYKEWFESWFARLLKILKPNASVYICSDWRSTYLIQDVAQKYLKVQNRITWEREKGRGAKSNWKNCSEDILFCTVSDDFVFNADKVKLKRKVIAPYRDENGNPKDWKDGFRLTYPSNLWTDISVPFWSMPENTDHPTQKPEKLLAKIILASSNEGDFIFDPFLGSGTTAVVAKKLNRKFSGVEIDEYYCCIAEKRLKLAEEDKSIQGYEDGVFWERNTLNLIRKNKNGNS